MIEDKNVLDAQRLAAEILRRQIEALELAGGDPLIIDILKGNLRNFRRAPASKFFRVPDLVGKQTGKSVSKVDPMMGLDALEQFVLQSDTTRKELEEIARARFDVPSGSMRSFRNIGMLREKILTLIRNEKGRDLIGRIAHKTRI